jgi:hypothetical protein
VWNDLVGATPTPTVSAIALGDYSTARYQATVVDTGQGSISTQTNMVYLKYTHAYLGQFP